MSKSNTPKSHARAPGQTQISVSMSAEMFEQIKAAAERDGRPVSNWVRAVIQRRLATDAARRDLDAGASFPAADETNTSTPRLPAAPPSPAPHPAPRTRRILRAVTKKQP